jgi:pSer/pThr/pTyr-binding forkhead associated (FHA) protein
MAANITLTIVRGRYVGKRFIFEAPGVYSVGRACDCALRLPDDEYHQTISRHHCEFDVEPPEIRVRDCGSRNGTYVNGVNIGLGHTASQAQAVFSLHAGDELHLGDTTLRVGVGLAEPEPCATENGRNFAEMTSA